MYLLKTGCLLAAFFSIHFSLYAQDPTALILKDIRSKCQEINTHRSAYRKVWVERSVAISEGGEATGYLNKDSIMLIEETQYWETGKSQTAFYYDRGIPVFIFAQISRYNVPFYDSSYNSNLTEVEEDRSYFHQGKMIRWIDAKKKVFSARDKVYVENEAGGLARAKELYDMILAADTHRKVSPPDKPQAK